MLDDVDWGNEIISATNSSGNEAIMKAKSNFRNNVIAKAIATAIENKNVDANKLVKMANLKIKTFNGLEKALGITNTNVFKVGGHGVGILDFFFLGTNLMDKWMSYDKNIGQKLDETGKTLTGFASSMLMSEGGMAIGAKIGAAIGSIFPGAGTLIGGFIGGALGAIAGSIIGNKIGEAAWDGSKNLVNTGTKKLAGIINSFSSGE